MGGASRIRDEDEDEDEDDENWLGAVQGLTRLRGKGKWIMYGSAVRVRGVMMKIWGSFR